MYNKILQLFVTLITVISVASLATGQTTLKIDSTTTLTAGFERNTRKIVVTNNGNCYIVFQNKSSNSPPRIAYSTNNGASFVKGDTIGPCENATGGTPDFTYSLSNYGDSIFATNNYVGINVSVDHPPHIRLMYGAINYGIYDSCFISPNTPDSLGTYYGGPTMFADGKLQLVFSPKSSKAFNLLTDGSFSQTSTWNVIDSATGSIWSAAGPSTVHHPHGTYLYDRINRDLYFADTTVGAGMPQIGTDFVLNPRALTSSVRWRSTTLVSGRATLQSGKDSLLYALTDAVGDSLVFQRFTSTNTTNPAYTPDAVSNLGNTLIEPTGYLPRVAHDSFCAWPTILVKRNTNEIYITYMYTADTVNNRAALDLVMRKSTDAGVTWGVRQTLKSGVAGYLFKELQAPPEINNTLFLAWTQNIGGGFDTLSVLSLDVSNIVHTKKLGKAWLGRSKF